MAPVKVCAKENIGKGYKNKNIHSLSDNQAATKAPGPSQS
jgi:hypothetical protein